MRRRLHTRSMEPRRSRWPQGTRFIFGAGAAKGTSASLALERAHFTPGEDIRKGRNKVGKQEPLLLLMTVSGSQLLVLVLAHLLPALLSDATQCHHPLSSQSVCSSLGPPGATPAKGRRCRGTNLREDDRLVKKKHCLTSGPSAIFHLAHSRKGA